MYLLNFCIKHKFLYSLHCQASCTLWNWLKILCSRANKNVNWKRVFLRLLFYHLMHTKNVHHLVQNCDSCIVCMLHQFSSLIRNSAMYWACILVIRLAEFSIHVEDCVHDWGGHTLSQSLCALEDFFSFYFFSSIHTQQRLLLKREKRKQLLNSMATNEWSWLKWKSKKQTQTQCSWLAVEHLPTFLQKNVPFTLFQCISPVGYIKFNFWSTCATVSEYRPNVLEILQTVLQNNTFWSVSGRLHKTGFV